jgi:hypothetical protein
MSVCRLHGGIPRKPSSFQIIAASTPGSVILMPQAIRRDPLKLHRSHDNSESTESKNGW